MKKFHEFEYKRPEYESVKASINTFIQEFKTATSVTRQIECVNGINAVRRDFESMSSICSIRYDMNTADAFYEAENDYFDEYEPLIQELVNQYYAVLVDSPFRNELEAAFGHHIFNLATNEMKCFSPEIIEDLQQENALVTMHTKLISSAAILFDGEERNLAQLRAYFQSKDRSVRKAAYEAYASFFSDHEAEFDNIYDRLVKLRTKMAKTLGFDSFVEMGYIRLNRTDYNAQMVAGYRKQVLEEVVPLALKLLEKQCKRLGLEALTYYDEPLRFKTGNPQPKGTPEEIVKNGMKMYSELSRETKEFFTFMEENGLFDLLSRKGKMGGGYCTFIPIEKSPFIFANFNGTSDDIDVLTHEAGHAFQVYCSRNYAIPEYVWPTLEACEIHSMSMEFFTYPWMELFFQEDVLKHRFAHLSEALLFLPYGVSVDEFQHEVYENPEASPDERKKIWRNIERKYMPMRNYADNDFYEKGTMWMRQSHIFETPFYYIDYTLAQVCAFQFYNRMEQNREKAWEDYKNLCNAGGSKPFLDLLKIAGIKNPFESGSVKESVLEIFKQVEAIDDSDF
ncbi:MAG TPA: M3 family oligoendopeptidase [Thermotogota bacterium]|nr:M3 family oligoendopeptidase [Thermotogota bacterium]HRW34562.1 M3 family oligoendopeptidase [Thermotogota bacterium]